MLTERQPGRQHSDMALPDERIRILRQRAHDQLCGKLCRASCGMHLFHSCCNFGREETGFFVRVARDGVGQCGPSDVQDQGPIYGPASSSRTGRINQRYHCADDRMNLFQYMHIIS